MQLLLAVDFLDGGEQHAVGLLPHHLARRQVEDRDDRLAHELLRLIELVDAGEDLARLAAAVVERELQKLFALLHGLAGKHLANAHVAFGKLVDRNVGQHRLGRRRLGGAADLLELGHRLVHVEAREERLALVDADLAGERAIDGVVPAAAVLCADLPEGLVAALGDKGRETDQAHTQRLDEVVHDLSQAGLVCLVLRQDPGRRLVDVLVGALDAAEHLFKRHMRLIDIHLPGIALRQGTDHALELLVHLLGLALGGQDAAEVLLDHRRRAGDKVAQVVCEVGVDRGDQKLVGERAVRAEGEGAQQEEAQRVHAKLLREDVGIDDVGGVVGLGFGNLAAVDDQPAVAVDLLRQGQAHAHEHGGPDDRMEADDLLAHDVHVGRPVFVEIIIAVVVQAQRRAVVEQRVDPYIHHMTRIKVHRDAPGEAGARDAQVLKTRLDEVVDHLVDAACRLEEGAALQQLLHGLGVFRETEEVGLLLGVLDGAAAVGALAVDELGLGPEALAVLAVFAAVLALVDVAVVVHLAEHALDGLDVIIVGRADEAVVGDVHQLPQVKDALLAGDDPVDEFLGRDARSLGLGLDLLAVLVGARQEHDVIAAQALVAGDRVGRHGAVGVADVQLVRGVVDRGRDIKGFLVHVSSLLYQS